MPKKEISGRNKGEEGGLSKGDRDGLNGEIDRHPTWHGKGGNSIFSRRGGGVDRGSNEETKGFISSCILYCDFDPQISNLCHLEFPGIFKCRWHWWKRS